RGRALPAGLPRGRHRGRHGQRDRCRHRRSSHRPRRAAGPRLLAHLWRRLHLPDHGGGAGGQAPGHPGAARMSAAAGTSTALPALPLGIRPRHLLTAAALIAYPLVADPFWTVQIGAQILFLGVIALSLMFLAGYGGMVSLSQMTVAGCAGYMVALFGTNHVNIGLAWPWWAQIPATLVLTTVVATLIGVLAVRTAGIYTIMITL